MICEIKNRRKSRATKGLTFKEALKEDGIYRYICVRNYKGWREAQFRYLVCFGKMYQLLHNQLHFIEVLGGSDKECFYVKTNERIIIE